MEASELTGMGVQEAWMKWGSHTHGWKSLEAPVTMQPKQGSYQA